MDLRDYILRLLAPAELGDEVVPGARLTGASTELGPRLTFDVDGDDVHVDVEPVNPQRPSAARSGRLMFSYRSSGAHRVDPRVGLALCRAVAAIAKSREDAVLGALAAAVQASRESPDEPTRVREITVQRLLEPAGTPRKRHYTLSPYVGCLIGCRFCYAQGRVLVARTLEGLPDVPWGSYVDVRVNAPEVLARELEELPPGPLKFCPIVSDPYQAVERRYGITRRCLEVIRDARAPRPVMVLTRSQLILRDAELLGSIPDAWGGVSIATVDDDVRRHFEPRGATVAERFAILRALRAAGVTTFAVVQPLLPGSITDLADALADAVTSVSIEVLHGVEGAEDDFAAPAYRESKEAAWQMSRALELEAALQARGIAAWRGELPFDP